MRRRLAAGAAAVALAALGAAACGDDGGSSSPEPVVIFGPYRAEEAASFTADLDDWAQENGIDVRYTGTGNIAADIQSRVAEADPPDIALVPQPGLVRSLYEDGELQAMPEAVVQQASDSMGADAMALGRFDDVQVGIPFRINAKSLVWYRPDRFEELGLSVPSTLGELEALVEAIEDRGEVPWCLGVEAQMASGWPATDWVEDIVVRQWGPDVYQQWIEGTVEFGDQRIAESFETFRGLVLASGRVAGGPSGVLRTPVTDGYQPLFTSPPGCVLYHAPSFATAWMPSGTSVGADGAVDVFTVPPVSPAATGEIVVGADLVVAFDTRPEVQAVLQFLASPDAVQSWTASGSFLSPSDAVPADQYAADTREVFTTVAAGDPELVIDASDAMPPGIGSDLLLQEITRWIGGVITYDQMAATLDEARASTLSGEPAVDPTVDSAG
jgi:alpha-glucoside transport system substrate-binding protein